jgi:hypothetical protein
MPASSAQRNKTLSAIIDREVLEIIFFLMYVDSCLVVQGDSVARVPKLLSIKNYVIDVMT